MKYGLRSEREAMALKLAVLADALAMLREQLEDAPGVEVEVWMDDDHLYLDAHLPHLDEEGLDLSLQGGRLLVTATN